jgi:acyl transferase domain-containing protein/acyl carrier protein
MDSLYDELKKVQNSYEDDKIGVVFEKVSSKSIAIVGMSIKSSEASNLDEFWNNLKQGRDSIRKLPDSRKLDYDTAYTLFTNNKPDPEMEYDECGYLDDIDKFDNSFFNIAPNEARVMDPNQRILLENICETIEDAGYSCDKLKSRNVGVYVGYSSDFGEEYKNYINKLDPSLLSISIPGNIKSIIASRISYFLDLKGPALLVDTACSSSLVAVHMACRAIKEGECEMAIASGVKIELLRASVLQADIGTDAKNFRSKTFDLDADGMGSGEGVGSVLLKPLHKALEDGNHIYAVILGSSINQDGKTIGITAPNPAAQADLLQKAWIEAGIHPETITYIEAHGTGTSLGDPIEIKGINEAFRRYTSKSQFCGIGSVKTNIGHLDNAAGIAGLIKAVLALHYKEIPRTINFNIPSPNINFAESPVYVVDKHIAWEVSGIPRRCGVSAFGLSGTNCHIILEEAPLQNQKKEEIKDEINQKFFTVSAKSKISLEALVEKYITFLKNNQALPIEDICFVANTGRGHYNYRLVVVVKSSAELLSKLQNIKGDRLITNQSQNIYYGEIRITRGEDENYIAATESDESIQYEALLVEILDGNKDKTLYETISKAYINGATINWNIVYKKQKRNRIRLPVYPFQKNRCWVENTVSDILKQQYIMQHPLVAEISVKSKNFDVFTTSLSCETHWELQEHRVGGRPVLVGVAYIEIVREIMQRYYRINTFEIKNVIFTLPFSLNDNEIKDLQVIVNHLNNEYSFSALSKDSSNEEWEEHFKAIVYPLEIRDEQKRQEINEITNNLSRLDSVSQGEMEEGFIKVGPRWDCVKEIFVGENKFFALIEIPEPYENDLKSYQLHPALLDWAVNIAIRRVEKGSYLPFSFGTFRLNGKMPKKFYSYLNVKNIDKDNTVTFDIELMDLDGRVFADIKDYVIKKVDNLMGDWYYSMSWVPAETIGSINKNLGCTVIIKKNNIICNQIAEQIRGCSDNLIEIELSDCYSYDSPNKLLVDINDENRYLGISQKLKEYSVSTIIHCGCLANVQECNEAENLDIGLTNGAYDVFLLAKALSDIKGSNALNLIIITKNAYEITKKESYLDPCGSALCGLAKVISNEYPAVISRCIDIEDSTQIIDLKNEIMNGSTHYIAAYRDGQRFLQELGVCDIESYGERDFKLVKDGTYIITGGLGGLGLEVALSIASKEKVNIVTISRMDITAKTNANNQLDNQNEKSYKKLQKIKEIESLGSSITMYQGDVCDYKRLEEIFNEVRSRTGMINGVIHCAGVAGDGFIMNKDIQKFKEVISPKVYGTWNLYKLTEKDHLDCFVTFSSITSIIGESGQSDYTAANAYLDTFVYLRNKKYKNTLNINWPAWKKVGMAFDFGVSEREDLFSPIIPSDALSLFHKALTHNVDSVIIGKMDFAEAAKMRLFFNLSKHLANKGNSSKPKTNDAKNEITLRITDYSNNQDNSIETRIAAIWAEVLGIKSLSLFDRFHDLGGNSIFAVDVYSKLDKEFPSIFSLSDIFKYPTVKQMSDFVEKNIGNKNEAAKTSIEPPSDNNVDNILEKLSKGEISVSEADMLIKI